MKCFQCKGAIRRPLPDEARRTIIAGTSSEEIKKQIPEFIDAGITHLIAADSGDDLGQSRTRPDDRRVLAPTAAGLSPTRGETHPRGAHAVPCA